MRRNRRSATPRTRWRPSLLARFGIISCLLMIAVGVVVGRGLAQTQRARVLQSSVESTKVIAETGIRPLLDPSWFALGFERVSPADQARLDTALSAAVANRTIVRLKFWNQLGRVVYSDDPAIMGRQFPRDENFERAMAGEVVSEIVPPSLDGESRDEAQFGTTVSVYVPLRLDVGGELTSDPSGRVVGAFEIYTSYAPVAAAIDHDTHRLELYLAGGFLVIYLSLFRIVAGASRRLRRQADENAFRATHDELTGLPNRRRLDAELEALRRAGRPFVLALFDLDRFNEVNDTLGHAQGDQVLVAIADRLRAVEGAAAIARVGGDEFVLVVADVTGADEASAFGRQVEAMLRPSIGVAGIRLCVSAAAGIVRSPDDGDDLHELFRHADIAMYAAKRDHVPWALYWPELDQFRPERLQVAAELREALEQGQIHLAYQPQVDLRTGEVVGVEALVRWHHPERGVIPPGAFLPVVENTELIGPLTWEVLDQACAQCAQWRADGHHLRVAVNLSARSITDPTLLDHVRSALSRHQLDPGALELELTESAVLGDHSRASNVLGALRELGVSLAVDDFGTGYASISYLTTLPFDVLKIDRSFVDRLVGDRTAAGVVGFTIDLAHHLGLEVIAEGVEDEATLGELVARGCGQAQGFHIARPMAASELTAWMAASPWSVRAADEPRAA